MRTWQPFPSTWGSAELCETGFRFALSEGYRNVVQVDSDGQHDPSGIPALLAELESSDLVLGARFAGEGEYAVRGPRHWAMVVLARILSGVARTPLTDTTSGFRASGPRAVAVFAADYPAEYLGDTIEALVIARAERAGHPSGARVDADPLWRHAIAQPV